MAEESIKIGDYILSSLDDDQIWLAHKDGEAMSVWKNELAEILEKYMAENF